jgi:hypothetical protein
MENKKLLRNLTAKRLTIIGLAGRSFVLAPFQRGMELPEEQLQWFPGLDGVSLKNQVHFSSDKPTTKSNVSDWIGTLVGFIFFALMMGSQFFSEQWRPWFLGIGGGASFLVILLLIWMAQRGRTTVMRTLAHRSSLALCVLIGLAIPSILIGWFGHGFELLGGALDGAHVATGEKLDESHWLALLARCLQLTLISCASVLPGLLYYLFDRQQIGTLRDRFEQQILRLDPNLTNLVEVRTKYGRQMDEAFGADAGVESSRLPGGTRWPVMVCMVAITLGWTLVLLPFGALDIHSRGDLSQLLRPRADAVVFGFLGTYFFALGTILRRYTRGDLRPKAYSSITVRVLLVMILSWVLQTLPEGPVVLAVAFLFGIFPESALTYIREYLRRRAAFKSAVASGQEQHPLTHLEEIDIYDRARLLDEGVTNVEGLAHHDLVDLMLETRIPVPRLVDWIDQAILYLHVTDYRTKAGDSQGQLEDIRPWLRSIGVRTATDLLTVCTTRSIEGLAGVGTERHQRLRVLNDAISDDEWLDYVLHWRSTRSTDEDEIDLAAYAEDAVPIVKAAVIPEVEIVAASGEPAAPSIPFSNSETTYVVGDRGP